MTQRPPWDDGTGREYVWDRMEREYHIIGGYTDGRKRHPLPLCGKELSDEARGMVSPGRRSPEQAVCRDCAERYQHAEAV